MRAWQVSSLGDPDEVLRWEEQLPAPEPGNGQVVVRVAAAACNFPDILLCRGGYQDKPQLPFIPGLEIAGEVVAADPGAAAAVGDKVIGTPPVGRGGYADYTVLDAESTLPWPPGMTAPQAAATFVTYQTALCALQARGQLRPGEVVLVHAGAGGVGSAAIQIARAMGARVIATAGGPEKCEIARAVGADEVIDYTREDIVARVRHATDGRGVDVAVDPVGGDIFDASRRVMAFEGRLLVVGFASGRIPETPANHVLMKNYAVVGVHWGRYRQLAPEKVVRWQAEIADYWRDGKIEPLVGAELPLTAAREALHLLGTRRTVGKVILIP